MSNKQFQPADTAEMLSGPEPKTGPVGASAYFDRAGMLWIAGCLVLAVGAGHLIPQLDTLLSPSAQPNRERMELSRSPVPVAPSNGTPAVVNGQAGGAAVMATGPSKVW